MLKITDPESERLKILDVSVLRGGWVVYFSRPILPIDTCNDDTLRSLCDVKKRWTAKHGTYWICVYNKEDLTYLMLKYN